MIRPLFLAPIITVICMHAPAYAANYVIQPVQTGRENARFDHGHATVENTQARGTVQVRPFITAHGNIAFSIAVFNSSSIPANLGWGDVSASSNGQSISIMSARQLIDKEKSRSMWKKIGVAAVSALGSTVAANQRDSYYGSISSQVGRYRVNQNYLLTTPSAYGQRQAEVITQQGYDAIASIQARLDQAQIDIGAANLELTTIDPGASGGGRIVLSRFKLTSYPQRIDLSVSWNGETYQFAFQIALEGTAQPHFTAYTMPERQIQPAAAITAVPAATYQPQQVVGLPKANYAIEGLQPPVIAMKSSSPIRVTARQGSAESDTYADRLARAQPVRGKNVQQGWTISD